LGLTVTTPTPIAGNPWDYVNAPATYQLYAGGPTYTVGNVANTYGTNLMGQTIAPNVLTNPLGVYVAGDDLNFLAGSNFTGILFMDNHKDMTFNGQGTQFNGVSMSLDGSSSAYQIPALMESDQLIVEDGTNTTVNGLVICWQRFVLRKGTQDTVFNLNGRLFGDRFEFSDRTEWVSLNESTWNQLYSTFSFQYSLPSGIKYFPAWLNLSFSQLKIQPKIVFQPPTNINYHWPDWTQPIYSKAAGDSGLRWNIVSWRDGL
jgi:hypothetical protein